ncbi:MAG: preprotein translocase subunit Sec61beta [Candidatus Hadarchaeales archaeon]
MRRREESMPPTGAGLIRYFREEGHGIKISPKAVIVFSVALIILEIVLRIFPVF